MVRHHSKAFCGQERVLLKGISSDNISCLYFRQLRKQISHPKKEYFVVKYINTIIRNNIRTHNEISSFISYLSVYFCTRWMSPNAFLDVTFQDRA